MVNQLLGLLLLGSASLSWATTSADEESFLKKVCSTPEGADTPLCVHASISGCTIEGRNYADDVSCPAVRKQGRPFRNIPAPVEPNPASARLQDPNFMKELSWVTEQVRSCGCACCHDTSRLKDYSLWDINKPYIWIEQMTRRGLVIMSGQLPSGGFGSIPSEDNNGFDRSRTGAPTTDVQRFESFFRAEADLRGITADEIAKMRPIFSIPGARP